jgi:hypothetical protein
LLGFGAHDDDFKPPVTAGGKRTPAPDTGTEMTRAQVASSAVAFARFAGSIVASGIFLLLLLGLASKPQATAVEREMQACQRPDQWIDRCSGLFYNHSLCMQQCANTPAPTERTDDPHAQTLQQLLGTDLTPLN